MSTDVGNQELALVEEQLRVAFEEVLAIMLEERDITKIVAETGYSERQFQRMLRGYVEVTIPVLAAVAHATGHVVRLTVQKKEERN